jgi:hypothetical protein
VISLVNAFKCPGRVAQKALRARSENLAYLNISRVWEK